MQIAEILGPLTGDASIWHTLNQRFSMKIDCGLMMTEHNEGLCILPETLAMLAARGLCLELDIYAPLDADEDAGS